MSLVGLEQSRSVQTNLSRTFYKSRHLHDLHIPTHALFATKLLVPYIFTLIVCSLQQAMMESSSTVIETAAVSLLTALSFNCSDRPHTHLWSRTSYLLELEPGHSGNREIPIEHRSCLHGSAIIYACGAVDRKLSHTVYSWAVLYKLQHKGFTNRLCVGTTS